MSYDPTERAPQNPDQQPAQPPVTPPTYGQAPPAPPAEGQAAPTQYSAQPPAPSYGQPPQSNPGYPSYGQPPRAGQPSNPAYPPYGQPQPGQSNPGFPPYGQPPQPGQPSNPGYPPYGQPPQPGQPSNPGYPSYGQPQPGQSNPGFPPYGQPPQPGQPSNPGLPPYGGQPSNPAYPPYGQPQQAAYGQSSPTQPAYGAPADPYAPQSSNPSLPPYGAQTEQYGQPPQQPWGGAVPPGYMPPAAPPKKGGAKLGIILLVIVLIVALLGGGGYIFYQNTRPKPIITLTSQYTDGATSVGASSTNLTLKGTDFTASSVITFLLDGKSVPGAPSAQSDSNGKLSATTLTVTDAWSVGTHTLTAKDASGYTTKAGVKVEIVTPGQANTPGPNGAPTDSANMSVVALVSAGASSGTADLTVTGSANGGTVCRNTDDGKPHSRTGLISGITYTETIVSTCSGTYKGGKLDYTETATTDKLVFANGLTCTAHVPFVNAHLQGTFTSGTSVSGTYSEDAVTIDCNAGTGSQTTTPSTGTWTGIAVVH